MHKTMWQSWGKQYPPEIHIKERKKKAFKYLFTEYNFTAIGTLMLASQGCKTTVAEKPNN